MSDSEKRKSKATVDTSDSEVSDSEFRSVLASYWSILTILSSDWSGMSPRSPNLTLRSLRQGDPHRPPPAAPQALVTSGREERAERGKGEELREVRFDNFALER